MSNVSHRPLPSCFTQEISAQGKGPTDWSTQEN
jgi:hypothetical protein